MSMLNLVHVVFLCSVHAQLRSCLSPLLGRGLKDWEELIEEEGLRIWKQCKEPGWEGL